MDIVFYPANETVGMTDSCNYKHTFSIAFLLLKIWYQWKSFARAYDNLCEGTTYLLLTSGKGVFYSWSTGTFYILKVKIPHGMCTLFKEKSC